MIEDLPYIFAVSVGFRHAFEADHLVAMSNIATKRSSPFSAMKDGVYWGLGHGSSILLVAIFILLLRNSIPESYFFIMEGAVGLMIIVLGIFRFAQFLRESAKEHAVDTDDRLGQERSHTEDIPKKDFHKLSYTVGIIHGLAGSGVLITTAVAAMKTTGTSLLFLVVFNVGCIGGMLVAAVLLGFPFFQKLKNFNKYFKRIQTWLLVFSCLISFLLGAQILLKNWFYFP